MWLSRDQSLFNFIKSNKTWYINSLQLWYKVHKLSLKYTEPQFWVHITADTTLQWEEHAVTSLYSLYMCSGIFLSSLPWCPLCPPRSWLLRDKQDKWQRILCGVENDLMEGKLWRNHKHSRLCLTEVEEVDRKFLVYLLPHVIVLLIIRFKQLITLVMWCLVQYKGSNIHSGAYGKWCLSCWPLLVKVCFTNEQLLIFTQQEKSTASTRIKLHPLSQSE